MKKVLAAGCFNIIHPGHIYFLKSAKKLGDELIVILANDENNRKQYAAPAIEREKLLRSLNIADKIFIGDAKDKSKIVKEIKPDIIALGYDQKMPDSLDNFEFVRINKFADYSTNRIYMKQKALKQSGI
jgi:FAD synthetase